MSPVTNQKIIWNKGFEEMTLEDMYRNGKKWDLICNGDRRMIHVCIQEEQDGYSKNPKKR